MCIRALHYGIPVTVAQFLKDAGSGEMRFLEETENAVILHTRDLFGFFRNMSEKEKEETAIQSMELLQRVKEILEKPCSAVENADIKRLVVLDEILTAVEYGILDVTMVKDFVSSLPVDTEVIMTGRSVPGELLETGDYITEYRALRHPYEKGIKARYGVEK